MGSFLVKNIDALLTVLIAVVASLFGLRRQCTASHVKQRAAKIVRIGGPIVLLIGILRFFIGPSAAPVWKRHQTHDGIASAEFPGEPQLRRQTGTINGLRAQRTTLYYDVPRKQISLALSSSSIPPNQPEIPDSERIGATKAVFTQQGFSVIREVPIELGAASGYALEIQREEGKIRVWMRIAYVAGGVYRVVASSGGSHHDDPVISQFLASFRIERNGK